jgi:hypothetical protein
MHVSFLSRTLTCAIITLLLAVPFLHLEKVRAASLTGVAITLSNDVAEASGANHTLSFTTATTSVIKRIQIRYSTSQGGTTKPTSLTLTSATLGTVSGIGSGWSISTAAANSGILIIDRATADLVNSNSAASIEFQNITNSAIDNCQPSNDILRDTCHVRITTYSDDGLTQVDEGDTTYTVQEDPFLSFMVEDVTSGSTHNGVTSNVSSASDSIAFGRIGPGTVRYGTHKITIASNAPHGYTVYAKLANAIIGTSYINNEFDQFGAVNATWTSPQNWSSPTGVLPNSNSGWFGANTSDTRLLGWTSASGKFGPLGMIERPVATSSGPDRSGSVIYVSYAIEGNTLQASDIYSGSLVYDIRPIF